jgi:CubicO group peptidase (beta-lactamase class C family)
MASSGQVSRDYWPTEAWRSSTPEEQGMDSQQLNHVTGYINSTHVAIDSVIVVRHGYIVYELYTGVWNEEWKHNLYSAGKSVTSILIGIALDKGFIKNVSQKVVDFFPNRTIANLDSRKMNMTLRHLLTMTTGLAWDEWSLPFDDPRNSDNGMQSSSDAVQYILDLPMASQPGVKWVYCSGASVLLGEILAQASHYSVETFARKFLFDPLGIGDVYWLHYPGGYTSTDGGLYMTPRDDARIGYLMLNNGTWDGKRIVSSSWVAESTNTTLRQSKMGNPSVDPSLGYGYQWWTFPEIGIYCAAGYSSQYIFCVPKSDLVVVFTASIPEDADDPTIYLLTIFIIPSVVSDHSLTAEPWQDTVIIVSLVAVAATLVLAGIYSAQKTRFRNEITQR